MSELTEKVRESSAFLFSESNRYFSPGFGYGGLDLSTLIEIASPRSNFGFFDFFTKPDPLIHAIDKPNEFYGTIAMDMFFIFHYQVNQRLVKMKLESIANTYHSLEGKLKDKRSKAAERLSGFDAERYCAVIRERYPSCIHTNLFGEVSLLGPRGVMQDVMDYLKQERGNTNRLMQELLGDDGYSRISNYLEKPHSLHLYDLIGKPSSVHFPANENQG